MPGNNSKVQNVQKLIQQHDRLLESEGRFHALIAAAPIAIGVFVGRDLVIEMPNQTFIDIVGKGPDITGKPLAEVMPEIITENQPFLQILDDVFTSGKIFQTFGTQVNIVKDGVLKEGYYDFSYTPLFDASGNVYAILDIAIDVTEDVVSRKQIARSEENLRNTILKAPVAMCILKGPAYVVQIANARMIEIWGTTIANVINKPIFEGLPEAKDQGIEDLLDHVYRTGETFTAQSLAVSLPRGGTTETVYLNFVYEAYREADGTISGIMAVATEVTPQVLAQHKIEEVVAQRTKELADANKALQQTNLELEQFAYIASHDMQEPLRKVITFTNLLENNLATIDERSRNYLNKITASTIRMSQLIYDVLNFSRLAKEGELYREVDLNVVLENITTDFELLIGQKGASVNISKLPTLVAVPLQMQQLFSNLISNGLKFSRIDVPPVITVSCRRLHSDERKEYKGLLDNTDYFLFSVEDNGIGFRKEHAQQIFKIFQRLHLKTEYSGTGIGLALCKKIVQNHHGEIWAESKGHDGAVFKMILPEKYDGQWIMDNGYTMTNVFDR